MKTIHWLLVANIVLTIVMLVIVLNGNYYEPGIVHPKYSSMLHSSGIMLNGTFIIWIGLLFGICILGIFSLALLQGSRKREKSINSAIRRLLVYGIIGYPLIFVLMVYTYWQYEQGAYSGFFLGFPYPTAIMLFAFGFAPLFFTLPYIINYDKWILTPSERKEFEQILLSKQSDIKQ